MDNSLEPTILSYNKNEGNDFNPEYVGLTFAKSKIEALSSQYGVSPNLIFLAASCITLTKYTNTTHILINTKFESDSSLLMFDEKNRKITVLDYIKEIDECLKDKSVPLKLDGAHFSYIYNDFEDDEGTCLVIVEESQLFSLKLKYDSNRYTRSYVLSFLKSFVKVLNQFGDYGISDLKIEDISLRAEEVLPDFELKTYPLVNVLLENQTIENSDKIALTTCSESYTFKEINEEANRIANALIKRGIEKGSKVSFMLKRDKTLITSFLGIIKAGCVAIPLDMNYPQGKISYIMKNSDSDHIITCEDVEGAISPDDLIGEGDASFPEVSLTPDDPVMILYTSGSTGNPKGVVLTHRGVANSTVTHINHLFEKLLTISSISFDIAISDILVTLINGSHLIFANDDEIRDILLLSDLIERTKPDFINITPSRVLSYLEVEEFGNALGQIKAIGCGGEQFGKNVFEAIKKHADIDIYNGYGPCETTFASNYRKITDPDIIGVGKSLLNYITDVRDIDGKLLPFGVIGELYIGGVGVSKGYYNLADKTEEVFVTVNGTDYYRTGDYAVQLPSGEIVIKGRLDNQIKLRGQRIDLEEIEQVIVRYGDIDNAVVIIHDLNGKDHLCAYFTSKRDIDSFELKSYLSEILSPFMVPTFLTQLDEMPFTPNGKIDRKALQKPEIDTQNVEPADDIERAIYDFCSDILNYNDFGVTDNLFKLGFTSLTLMRLNSDIYREFGVLLGHNELEVNPTVRQISKLLDKSSSIERIERIEPSSSGKYPMSSQQKRLYAIWRRNQDLTNYNIPFIRKATSQIDINRLENAVNEVINAEEILRTSFHVEDGEYIQKIHKSRPIKVDFIDDFELKQHIQPFDLESDALLRIGVFESEAKTYIFRDIHHIIADQISNDTLYEKIRDAYHGKTLSPSYVQYKDYVYWVAKKQDSEAEYWKSREISQTGTELFPDFRRPLHQTFNIDNVSVDLDKKSIEKFAKDHNTTVYKLLLSHFIVLLYKYTHDKNIQIGTITSGRTHPDLDNTLGMFVNTLPFTQEVSSEDTLAETLIKTEREMSDLLSNQNYSIEKIISDHGMSSNTSSNPLFNIVFLQNTADEFPEFEWSESKFDLMCKIENSPSDLRVVVEYNRDLYSFEKIDSFLAHYVNLIDAIGDNLDKRIKDIEVLTPPERESLIEMAGFDENLSYDSILGRFEKQLDKHPGKIILSDDKASLSYADFNLKVNSLANYLKNNYAISKGDCVAVMAKRSIESVICFYAILKLNAVYVPINPFAPKDLLRHIVSEVDAKLVIGNVDLCDVNLDDETLYLGDNDEVGFASFDDLCILHTSGTTGVPKGVRISHKNILNFLVNAKRRFFDEDISVFYHTTNIAFDTSLFEILFSILNGIRLHVIGEDYDFKKIPQDIINQKSIINTVPSKLKMFLALENFENVMKNVSELILAGEALGESLVREIQKDYDAQIFNAYGPCEATIFASIKEIASADEITIGKANVNTGIYILSPDKQLCPVGVPGEICIGGSQVSDGYLNKTEKVFIENPFSDGKLYCTGDLAYLDVKGEINYLERKDSQIKINGQRIELDEINRQIERNSKINQAVTVPNSDKTKLYSYIVSDDAIDTDKLLSDLETRLLPFMLPVSIMQIDHIPINSNGKIDAGRLPEPKMAKNKYSPPTNDAEKAIIKIWQDILEIKPIGIHDNFYHLGGNSIKAIRIISLLQNEGIILSPGDILKFKTPYLIAQNVGKTKISYDSLEGEIGLLPIQKYFFDKIARNDYVQSYVLKSEIDLDISTLQDAFNELTDLHDMLRARFKIENEEYLSEILPLNTRICEISELEVSQNDFSGIIDNAKKSLDISNKLIDVSLVHFEDECYLIFVIHHLIVDGVSWAVLLDDLTYIYNQITLGGEINLSRPYPYKSWIEDVKSLAENISDDEKDYWNNINELLDDVAIEGRPKPFDFTVDNDYKTSILSEEEYLALAISRAYKKTYSKDMIFNVESHGRDEALGDVSRTVGWFTSQYPVPVDSTGDDDDIALMMDALNLKKAFRKINNLGLNYLSLIYDTDELTFKHCPVTFNFLSSEFSFKNEMFEAVDLTQDLSANETHCGIELNIFSVDGNYLVKGICAEDTFLEDGLSEFIDNIWRELDFILMDRPIICPLSESQMGVYLDEKVHEKQAAYTTSGIVECGSKFKIDEIKSAILKVIDKHPILKSRIVEDNIPLLVCDALPEIKVVSNVSKREFDMGKSLSRFYIIDDNERKAVLFEAHHIINDATSSTIISRELIEALKGSLDESTDYGFVYASRESFESQFRAEYESSREFFYEMFCEIDEVGYMLGDSDGSCGTVILPIIGIKSQVEEFAHDLGITVGNLLNAVFAYAYSRFSGTSKVQYNFTEHGRHESYCQDALGMFVRTIPIIIDCKDTSVKSYLTQVSNLILKSMSNSAYPFSLIANEFGLRNEVLFEYNYDLNDVSDIGDEMIFKDDADGVSEFLCVINDLKDGYAVGVSHLDKYSRNTVVSFLESFKEILSQILEKENLGDIIYIQKDHLKILDGYNETGHSLNYEDILDAFNDNISDNNLVSIDDNVYSYSQAAFIADRIAEELLASGVMPGDCVAFLTERSGHYMFAVLAIMSVGGVYVPLDDKLPDERISFMLEDTSSKALVVSGETLDRAKGLSDNIVNISDILNEDIDSLNHLPVVYNDLACILYTSGTTGIPKGVKIKRKALLNLSAFYTENYNLREDDVYGLFSSIGFDVSNFVIACVIYAGASLSVVPEDIRLNMNLMNDYFITQGVTHAFLTTQVAKLFMKSIQKTSLDVLLVAGEKLGEVESPSDYILVDAFGPTEAFAFNTSIKNSDKTDSSSIGYLNYNTKAYVLDEEKRRVPPGAVGELYLSGYQIAEGYLNRDRQSRDAFVDNPFDDYGMMYRTGDMVRFLSDGSLAIVGRRDSQVKVRGNRVELSEVESVIREIEFIDDVTVQTIKNQDNNELVAYIVASKDIKDEVSDYVSERKPEYMVPSFVVELESIPLNINGKVDKKALPEVDFESLHADYVKPTNEIEKKIVDAFNVAFNQKDIGLNDDFARLGGDSITAIRVILELQKDNINVTPRDILNYKTPYIIAKNTAKSDEIIYDAVEGEVNLLPIQSYFFDMIERNDYVQEFLLKGDVDLRTLQDAFDKLSDVHDMLRAVFKDKKQIIRPVGTRVCEIGEYNCDFDEVYAKSLASIDINEKLIDVSLIHKNGESYVLFVIHHLIIDGVSWSVLLSDLTYIYQQLLLGREIDLKRPYPYRDWVSKVEELVGNITEEEKSHWIEVNNLLDDSSIKGISKSFSFNVESSYDIDNLLMLSEEEFLALATARAYKKTYGKDIIFNRETHGRDDNLADVSRTVGWFTSQYPVPVKISGQYDDVSIINDAYRLKDAFLDIDNLGLNYESLIYITHDLEFRHCPVTFNFLSTEFEFKNELFTSIKHDFNQTVDDESYGITLNISCENDHYFIAGDYAEDTFIGDKFTKFIENIKRELDFIAGYDGNIIAPLSESQLEVYFDEKENDMKTAYLTEETFRCPQDKSFGEIEIAIHTLIEKHPILKGRILENGNLPLLVCDGYPSIESIKHEDYADLIAPFDLKENLTRFFITEDKNIICNIHHIINDATSFKIIGKDLTEIFEGNFDKTSDLGFLRASRDSFSSRFDSNYNRAHEYYLKQLQDVGKTAQLKQDTNGKRGIVSLPIHGIRQNVEKLCKNTNITVGTLLNAAFACTYSRFIQSPEVYYNFVDHGRHEDYLKDAVGMFARTIPVLVDCTHKDYLRYFSDLALNSMMNSSYPYRLLKKELNLNNTVLFEYNSDLNDVSKIDDEIIISGDTQDAFAEFFCIVNDLSDGYVIHIKHSDFFTSDTAISFVKLYERVLTNFLDAFSL